MTAAEEQYAAALAGAIIASLKSEPPPGLLVRVVIRWFEGPDYLTIHALGSDEEHAVAASDAWLALEWPNADREIDRVNAVLGDARAAAAVETLGAEVGEEGWSWDEQPAPLVAAAQLLRGMAADAGLPVAGHFAAGVSHFEGWGPEQSVPACTPQAVLDLLEQRGLLPGSEQPPSRSPRGAHVSLGRLRDRVRRRRA